MTEKDVSFKSTHKKDRVVLLIKDEADFETKRITKDKGECIFMIKS